MITNNDSRMGGNVQLIGLSTDQKPTDVSPNSLFLELDTKEIYYNTDMGWSKAGEPAKQGIVSVEISPAIESDPSLDYYFPMAYDASDPIGSYIWLYTQEALDDEVEYTVTVTPCSEWCCFSPDNEGLMPKGQPDIMKLHPSDGVLSIDVYAEEPVTGNHISVAISMGID